MLLAQVKPKSLAGALSFRRRCHSMTTVKVTALIASAVFAAATSAESQLPVVLPRVVEVDGRPVRVLTLGLENRVAGEPVFVLQSGGGMSIETWDPTLVRTLAMLAPVVAYDRPGLGGSQFDGLSPSPERVAAHLTNVLGVLGAGPPYILIGHSWGGPLILYFAAQHPDDIAGLVYLDPSLPHRDPILTDSAGPAALLAQFDSSTMSWPEGRRAGTRAFYDYFLTPPELRAIPPNLNVPTAVVLSNLLSGAGPDADRAAVEAAQERYVQETQTWLRDVDPLHFVVAQYAGHFVHRDAPDLVVEAIRQVFSWAQGQP